VSDTLAKKEKSNTDGASWLELNLIHVPW